MRIRDDRKGENPSYIITVPQHRLQDSEEPAWHGYLYAALLFTREEDEHLG
jgi:hypothetical protein